MGPKVALTFLCSCTTLVIGIESRIVTLFFCVLSWLMRPTVAPVDGPLSIVIVVYSAEGTMYVIVISIQGISEMRIKFICFYITR